MITIILGLIGLILDVLIIGGLAIFIICLPFILIWKIFDLIETKIMMSRRLK